MHYIPLLQDILVLLCFSVIIVFLLQRFKLPSIIGFLITGVVIGPFGLSVVKAVAEVEILAEIGVILLLFVIGMELSIKQLMSIKKTVFVGGLMQVGLTAAITALVCYGAGYAWNQAVFVGFLFSLSSTAIVLKALQDKNEMSAPHGRNALAILIFQDIIVVPMMLFVPIIAGQSTNLTLSVVSLLIKSSIVIGITIVSARYIVPKVLYAVAKTNSKELFLLITITLCFLVAFLTSQAGLSLALGAFLAGLIISESDYSHQATSIILPFRELFTSFFFVSVGMLLDVQFFIGNIGVIILIVLVVFIVKSALASLAVAVLRYPLRTVLLTGFSLFQVGEFAFILSKVGIEYNLLSVETNQYFLAVSILSMLLTPFMILSAETIVQAMLRFFQRIGINVATVLMQSQRKEQETELTNHLIIIGYGINGRNVAAVARLSNIPYVVIELNAETVKQERSKGAPLVFGDATHEHILETVNLSQARIVVVAISDIQATKIIVAKIRAMSSSLHIVVRTRYVKEIAELTALGANEVIPEEFETSIEIFSRVLRNFLIPEDDIERLSQTIRSDNYEVFQSEQHHPKTFRVPNIPDFTITCVRVMKDSGKLIGKPLKTLNLRADYGVNIISISRNDHVIDSITPDDMLLQGDLVFVHGKPSKIEAFHRMVK